MSAKQQNVFVCISVCKEGYRLSEKEELVGKECFSNEGLKDQTRLRTVSCNLVANPKTKTNIRLNVNQLMKETQYKLNLKLSA